MRYLNHYITSLFIIFNIFYGNSQTNGKIKSIVKTETYGINHSDGKQYIFTSEINKTEYNLKGQKTKKTRITYYNGKPNNTIISDFFYTSQDKIDYTYTLILEDSIYYRTNYSYSKNQLFNINSTSINNNKKSLYNENYTYNKKEKLIKSNYLYIEKYTDSDINLRFLKCEFTYNKNEYLIESNWLQSDSTYKYNRIVHFRNRKGRLIKEKEYNKNNDLINERFFKYSYDKKKNWTLKRVYEDKICVKTIIREIEYYN